MAVLTLFACVSLPTLDHYLAQMGVDFESADRIGKVVTLGWIALMIGLLVTVLRYNKRIERH